MNLWDGLSDMLLGVELLPRKSVGTRRGLGCGLVKVKVSHFGYATRCTSSQDSAIILILLLTFFYEN